MDLCRGTRICLACWITPCCGRRRPRPTSCGFCAEAKEHGFVVIFVPPCYVDEAVAAVAGTAVQSAFRSGFRSAGIRPMRRSRRRSKRWRMARSAEHGHQHQPPEIRRL